MLQGQTCVVFDLDGTLADTSDDLLASANACFRAMGAGDLLTLSLIHISEPTRPY